MTDKTQLEKEWSTDFRAMPKNDHVIVKPPKALNAKRVMVRFVRLSFGLGELVLGILQEYE